MRNISIEGLIYKLVYIFHRHYLFGWTLTRWLILGLLSLPIISFIIVFPKNNIALALFSTVSVISIITIWKIKRQGYLRFQEESDTPSTSNTTQLVSPFQKITIQASGHFSVQSATTYFVEEVAQYQVFETRERVIMTAIFHSRFLLLAQSPPHQIGWWYMFFSPPHLQNIKSGWLHFGRKPRPALQLQCLFNNNNNPQIFYLSFDTPAQRAIIAADLQSDCA